MCGRVSLTDDEQSQGTGRLSSLYLAMDEVEGKAMKRYIGIRTEKFQQNKKKRILQQLSIILDLICT